MTSSETSDDRSAVRALARRHPEWSNRMIGRELGRSGRFVARWLARDSRSQRRTVRSEAFDKKVKRKMVGSVRVEGEEKEGEYWETVKELRGGGDRVWLLYSTTVCKGDSCISKKKEEGGVK